MNIFSKLSKHERVVLACAEVAFKDGSCGTYIGDVNEKKAANMLAKRGLVNIKKPPRGEVAKGDVAWWIVTLVDTSNPRIQRYLLSVQP